MATIEDLQTEIRELSSATTSLLNAVSFKRDLLDAVEPNAQIAQISAQQAVLSAANASASEGAALASENSASAAASAAATSETNAATSAASASSSESAAASSAAAANSSKNAAEAAEAAAAASAAAALSSESVAAAQAATATTKAAEAAASAQLAVDTANNISTGVVSVNGRSGTVTLSSSDVGLSNVQNVTQAPAARAITAGAGLSGGGDLTADRTISLGMPGSLTTSTANAVTAGGHTHEVTFPVISVAGKTGAVSLTKADVGLGNIDNTADSVKNVLSAAQLATARTINGVPFDGTQNINVTIGDATTSVAGKVQLNNTLTSASTSQALTAAQGKALQDGKLAVYAVTTTAVNKTLAKRERCFASVSGLTITLPSAPVVGDEVAVSVADFSNTVVARNGQNIMGLAEDMTVDRTNATVHLLFVGASIGWRII